MPSNPFTRRKPWIALARNLCMVTTSTTAVAGVATMLALTAARAQLGPLPGIPASTLGQPNGPAQLGPDGSASALMALGRTLAARAGDRVNILDAPYAAKCDGRLVNGAWLGDDDTAALASALAAAIAQHKTLYIPGGNGYCLMRTGNPLGQVGAGAPSISGSLTIAGDGKDVSRLVWFLDDPAGSLAGIASPGIGYAVGNMLTVVGGTATGTAMQVKVLAVNATGGITAATAWGTPSYTTMPPPGAATTGGAGAGATVNVVAGGAAIGSPYQGNAATRTAGVALTNFSIIGQGHQNPVQSTCAGAMAISLYSINDIVIDGAGVDYSRCMSIAVRTSQGVTITRNRIRWSSRDGINISSPWSVIADNTLEHVGDDGIAATDDPSEAGALPAREGVVVSGNFMTDTQGIVTLGAADIAVTGNTLVRPKNRAINVSTGSGGEGSTPTRVVTVTGNAITDLLSVANDPISASYPPRCIVVGSTPAQPGNAPGIPGFPVTGTGEFVSPYPYMTANGLSSTQPIPPGLYVTVASNSCVRTLNASPNNATSPIMFSSLGFGLVYGAAGWLDFPMLHSSVSEAIGIVIEKGIVQNLKVTGNTFAGLLYGINVLSGAQLLDAEFIQNTFRDIATFGIAWTAPAAPNQRITFEDNLWDGDPYFANSGRVSSGTATDGQPLFTGAWTGALPQLAFNMPGGVEWRHNRIRNWATLGNFPTTGRVIANTLYANSGTGIGGTLPPASEGWDVITEDGAPASATFGQVLSVSTRDLATGCIAGRYAATAGVPQCLTPGAGVTLSGAGVLSASLPSKLIAAQIAAGGVVGSIAITNGGGYVLTPPSITLAAPPAGGAQAAAVVSSLGMGSWSVVNGGSGYTVGQYLIIQGGACSTNPALVVTSVGAGGAVTGTSGANGGVCSTLPNPYTTSTTLGSGITGSGATFNVSWFVNGVTVVNGGSGYTAAASVTFSPSTSPLAFSGTATGTSSLVNVLSLGASGPSGSGIASQGAFSDASKVRLTATGAAYAIPPNTSWLAMVQTATVATQALTLPATPADGQVLRLTTASAITALTLSPAVPAWTNGATLPAHTGFELGWDAASTTWIPLTGGAGLGPPLNPVTNTYTASGPIANTDTFALINAATAVTMTLAGGTTDGHNTVINNYGSAAVTISLILGGSPSNITLASGKALNITWNVALATYLLNA